MAEVKELELQAPDMMHSLFYVKMQGKEFQTWEHSFYGGEEIEFFLQSQLTGERWQSGKVTRSYIDDASGNAPGADAHFRVEWQEQGQYWRCDLYGGLRVKLETPTVEELIASSVWCEGGEWGGEWNAPAKWEPCGKKGKRYVSPGGQESWYCDDHIPEWAKGQEVAQK